MNNPTDNKSSPKSTKQPIPNVLDYREGLELDEEAKARFAGKKRGQATLSYALK